MISDQQRYELWGGYYFILSVIYQWFYQVVSTMSSLDL